MKAKSYRLRCLQVWWKQGNVRFIALFTCFPAIYWSVYFLFGSFLLSGCLSGENKTEVSLQEMHSSLLDFFLDLEEPAGAMAPWRKQICGFRTCLHGSQQLLRNFHLIGPERRNELWVVSQIAHQIFGESNSAIHQSFASTSWSEWLGRY